MEPLEQHTKACGGAAVASRVRRLDTLFPALFWQGAAPFLQNVLEGSQKALTAVRGIQVEVSLPGSRTIHGVYRKARFWYDDRFIDF